MLTYTHTVYASVPGLVSFFTAVKRQHDQANL